MRRMNGQLRHRHDTQEPGWKNSSDSYSSYVLCDTSACGFPILHASDGFQKLYGAGYSSDLMKMLQMTESTSTAIEDWPLDGYGAVKPSIIKN